MLTDEDLERSRIAVTVAPLPRSPEFMALVEQVASNVGSVEFDEEWIDSLVEDLVKFND